MNTGRQWKSGNSLDSIMNVLLIVLALGMLGVSALEVDSGVTHVASSGQQRA